MAKVQNGEETLPKVSTPRVGRTKVTDDRQTENFKRILLRLNSKECFTAAFVGHESGP